MGVFRPSARPGCRGDPLESRPPASRQNSEFGGVAQIRQGQRGRHRLSRHLPARECDVGPRMSCLTKARGDRRGSQPGATVPSTPGDTRQRLETFWPSPPELGAGVLRHLVGSVTRVAAQLRASHRTAPRPERVTPPESTGPRWRNGTSTQQSLRPPSPSLHERCLASAEESQKV